MGAGEERLVQGSEQVTGCRPAPGSLPARREQKPQVPEWGPGRSRQGHGQVRVKLDKPHGNLFLSFCFEDFLALAWEFRTQIKYE